jgi:translation elongation factor EF-G
VRHRDRRGQFDFAAHAKHLVPQDGNFVIAKSHRGLHLLARSEDDLAAPLRTLRGAYGSSLHINPEQRGEPVMEVRIGLERRYLPEVREALQRRGANASEEYLGPHYCVLRFEARLAALLGLTGEIATLASGKSSQQIVLSGYA